MPSKNLNDNERKVLRALARGYNEYEDFIYSGFQSLARRTRLARKEVRRAARSLKRKGLAQFQSGLWTEDGELAGSGYACTSAGYEMIGKPRPDYRY